MIESDHKPLSTIIRKPISTAPKRLRRMLYQLARYDLKIQYKRGEEMYLADTLSRAFLPGSAEEEQQPEICLQILQIDLEDSVDPGMIKEIRSAARVDPELQVLTKMVQEGWPRSKADTPDIVKPFYSYRDTISMQNGLLDKDCRVIIPKALRTKMMQQLHSSHQGMESCLRRARESFFWPSITGAVREYISGCGVCNTVKLAQEREPLQSSDTPERPWTKVGMDIFEFDKINYLVIVDYYSSYLEVEPLKDLSAATTILRVKSAFARHGIPETVVSDNGTQFVNAEFKSFAVTWKFSHITSSPRYPQSNGKAESAVKICKNIMKKAKLVKADTYLALMDYGATPLESMKASPAQLSFGRRIRTRLPVKSSMLDRKTQEQPVVQQRIGDKKEKQQRIYDQHAKKLPDLKPGVTIRMKRPGCTEWSPAICTKRLNKKRSYSVECGNTKYRRNRRQLRLTLEDPKLRKESDEQMFLEPIKCANNPPREGRRNDTFCAKDASSKGSKPGQPRQRTEVDNAERRGEIQLQSTTDQKAEAFRHLRHFVLKTKEGVTCL